MNHLTEEKSLSPVKDAMVRRVYSTSTGCANVQETRFKSASGQEVRIDAVQHLSSARLDILYYGIIRSENNSTQIARHTYSISHMISSVIPSLMTRCRHSVSMGGDADKRFKNPGISKQNI